MLKSITLVLVIAAVPTEPPKTVTFPSRVKTTELEAPQAREISEIEALLKADGVLPEEQQISLSWLNCRQQTELKT